MTTGPVEDFALTTAHPDHRTAVLGVRGALDYDSADELQEAVTAVLADGPGVACLRLDLAGVTMCDSMGLAALLMIRRRTAADGVRLVLRPRPAALDRLLEVTGTSDHLLAETHEPA